MLTIRLTRKGKKNQPFFRIVVIDKRRTAKGGRAVEELGYINPLTKKHSLEKERILYWISKGAKPTPRIHNLLVSEKVIEAKKIKTFSMKKGKGTATATATATAPAAPAAPQTAAPAEAKTQEAPTVSAETPAPEPEKSTEPKIEEKLAEAPMEPPAQP